MGSGVLKKTGRFQGTGAEKWIPLDFHPVYVKVSNLTTPSSVETFESVDGGVRTVTAGTQSVLAAAAGIKLGDPANPDAMGFFVGTDDACNKDGDDLVFLAVE